MGDQSIFRTSTRPFAARVTVTSTAVAVPCASGSVRLTECAVQADPSNTVNLLVGTEAAQCWVLRPADQLVWDIGNPGLLWVKLETGASAILNLIGRYGE